MLLHVYMYIYTTVFDSICGYLVGLLADVLSDVPSAFDYFGEGARGHCNAGKNSTPHLSITIIFQNQHVR